MLIVSIISMMKFHTLASPRAQCLLYKDALVFLGFHRNIELKTSTQKHKFAEFADRIHQNKQGIECKRLSEGQEGRNSLRFNNMCFTYANVTRLFSYYFFSSCPFKIVPFSLYFFLPFFFRFFFIYSIYDHETGILSQTSQGCKQKGSLTPNHKGNTLEKTPTKYPYDRLRKEPLKNRTIKNSKLKLQEQNEFIQRSQLIIKNWLSKLNQ